MKGDSKKCNATGKETKDGQNCKNKEYDNSGYCYRHRRISGGDEK